MRKPEESAADRIWKEKLEKLESCASLRECGVILLFMLALALVGALLAAA
jgi:hypothetical protein